jgi:hypothetical protein
MPIGLSLSFMRNIVVEDCGAARYYIPQKRNGQWMQYSPAGLKTETIGNT